jgi:hypothetical protein
VKGCPNFLSLRTFADPLILWALATPVNARGIALISFVPFINVAVVTFRRDGHVEVSDKKSGTGGFAQRIKKAERV